MLARVARVGDGEHELGFELEFELGFELGFVVESLLLLGSS